MKVVIPGASGFIGRNLLINAPKTWDILAIYNSSEDLPSFVEKHDLKKVQTVRCDLRNAEATQVLAGKHDRFDVCVFLAANGNPAFSVKNPLADLESTTYTLLNFINAFDVVKLIYFSSGAVYDGLKGAVSPDLSLSPKLPYAVSNLASENHLLDFASKGKIEEYVILRFFGAYGPYEPPRKIFSRLVNAFYFDNNDTFKLRGDGNNYIDAMYVKDAIDGVFKVIESTNKNLTIDFCNGQKLTINELVEQTADIFGRNGVKIVHEGQSAEPIAFWANPKTMEKEYDFKPKIGLKDGYDRLVGFLKNGDSR